MLKKISMMSLIFALLISTLAYAKTDSLTVEDIKGPFTYIIVDVEESVEFIRSLPEKTATKSVTYNVKDRNGVLIGQYKVKVTGIFSTADRMSEITDVTVTTVSGDSSISDYTEYNGASARTYVDWYGATILDLTSKISTNGAITISR